MSAPTQCPDCGYAMPPTAPRGFCPHCLLGGTAGTRTHHSNPAAFEPPTPQELDTQTPDLEVIELIGRGGMGAVYKARQLRLNRPVAVKVLPPMADEETSVLFDERFEREAQTTAALNHPHIITVYDFGETLDGLPYIVMEYVEGATLAQLIRNGEVQPNQALEWAAQICEALNYAHTQGVIHRDIKPANILVSDETQQIKIADFGIARLIGDPGQTQMTLTHVALGTPDYSAPEQLAPDAKVDHRSDIYAFGVMMYEMITGNIPRGAWEPPSTQNRQAPRAVDTIVRRALQNDPAERYQSATEISTALTKIPRYSVAKPSVSHKWPLLAGVIGIIILSLSLLQFLKPTPSSKSAPLPPGVRLDGDTAFVEQDAVIADPVEGITRWHLRQGNVSFSPGAVTEAHELSIDGATLRVGDGWTIGALQHDDGQLVLDGPITAARARLQFLAVPVGEHTAADLASLGLASGLVDQGGTLTITEGGYPAPIDDRVRIHFVDEVQNLSWPTAKFWRGPPPGTMPSDAPGTDFSPYDYELGAFSFLDHTEDAYFGGRTLTLAPGGHLRLSGALTVPELRLNGGVITRKAFAAGLPTLSGDVMVLAESTISAGTTMKARLKGDGGLIVSGKSDVPAERRKLRLSASSPEYHGRWTIRGGLVSAEAIEALGDGPIVLTNGGHLVASQEIANASLDIVNEGILSLQHQASFGHVRLDGANVSPGEYDFAALEALGLGRFFRDLGGKLLVQQEAPPSTRPSEPAQGGRLVKLKPADQTEETRGGWHWPKLWEGDQAPALARMMPDGQLAGSSPDLYVVGKGKTLRSPPYGIGNYYFGGASLILDGGRMELWGSGGGIYFRELVLGSRGALFHAEWNYPRNTKIYGNILVRDDFDFGRQKDQGAGTTIIVAQMRGAEGNRLYVDIGEKSTIVLLGKNEALNSTWTIQSGTLIADEKGSLGTGDILVVAEARLVINRPQKLNHLGITGHILLNSDVIAQGVIYRGRVLPPGRYTAHEMNVHLKKEAPPVTGNGTLTVLQAGD